MQTIPDGVTTHVTITTTKGMLPLPFTAARLGLCKNTSRLVWTQPHTLVLQNILYIGTSVMQRVHCIGNSNGLEIKVFLYSNDLRMPNCTQIV